MAELTIYGASDDLVEVEGLFTNEFYVQGDNEAVTLLVTCPDGRSCKVRVAYVDGGVWAVSYQPSDEDVPAPTGRVECGGYTARLILDVPEGTKVHRLAEAHA